MPMPATTGKSAYLERAVLDYLLPPSGGATTYSAPSQLYVALYTGGTVNEDGTLGSGVSEVSGTGTGYSRVAINNGGTNSIWTAASSDANTGVTTKTNNADITFPTATSSWGTLTGFAIWRVSTGGSATDLIIAGLLTTSVNINTNDQFKIPAGSLIITEE